jgi:hypothetical protein
MDIPDIRLVAMEQTGADRYLLTADQDVHAGAELLPDLLPLERVLWRLGLTVTSPERPAAMRMFQPPGLPLVGSEMPDSSQQFWAVRPRRDVPLPTVQQINAALAVYEPPQMQICVNPLDLRGYMLAVCEDEDDRIGEAAEYFAARAEGIEQILAWNERPRALQGFRSSIALVARIDLSVDSRQLIIAIRDALGLPQA